MTLVFLGIYMGQWERVWVLKVIWPRFEFQLCDLGQISKTLSLSSLICKMGEEDNSQLTEHFRK